MTHHFLKFLPLIQQLVVKLGVHRTKTGSQHGLTNMLMGILDTIRHQNGCIMRVVAEENLISLPAASRMVNELVKKKFVERSPDLLDRRSVHLRITPEGEKIMLIVHQESASIIEKMLNTMNLEEQEALEKGLLAFVRAMQDKSVSQ